MFTRQARNSGSLLWVLFVLLGAFIAGCVSTTLVAPIEPSSSLVIGRVVINNKNSGQYYGVLPTGVVTRGVGIEVETRDGNVVNAVTDENGFFFLPNIVPNNYYIHRVKFEGSRSGFGGGRESMAYTMQKLPFTPAPGKAGYIGTLNVDINERGIATYREVREDDSARGYFFQNYGASQWARREFAAIGPLPVPASQIVETSQQPRLVGRAGKAEKPDWKVGYQWQYSWKDRSGNGTLTKEIIREDVFGGVASFVLKRAKSEDFYTKDVLGLLGTMTGGQITVKRNAPFQTLSWPLEVGKEWHNSYIVERLDEKTSSSLEHRVVATKLESVKVPAGTFDAFKIEVYNARSGSLLNEFWYVPEVKWFIKYRTYNADSVREEELLSFKVE